MIAGLVFAAAALLAALAAYAYWLSRRIEARYPPPGERIDLGPGALHFVETRPAGAQRGTVVLVHGASGNFADLHVPLAERLAQLGYRVFAFDRPGHGWSDRLDPRRRASSPERQAEWIRAALERRGVREAIFVVHSLAGVLGLSMALEAPKFTRGLVLLAAVSHPWPGGVSWYYTLAATPVVGPLFRWLVVPWAAPLAMKSGLDSVFAPSPTPENYAARTGLELMLRPWHFRSNAEDVVDIEAHVARLHPRYASITVPTAILHGDRDEVVSLTIHARQSARDIPGATLKVLSEVGHSPHFSDPDAVIAAIEDVDRRAGALEAGPRTERMESA